MTTTYSDLTNLVEIMKYVYGQGLTNQFKDEVMTYNQFPTSGIKPAGKGFVGGIRYSRSQSVGARQESVILPDPFTGTKDQFLILPKNVYGTMKITGPAIEMAKGGPASFVDSLSDEMDDIYQSLIVQMNRMSHSDGFGLIGTTSALATPSTSATWDAVFDNKVGVQYFQIGMLVDFYQSGAIDQTCVAQRVSAINPSTKTVTFEASGQTYLAHHPITAAQSYTNSSSTVASGSLAVAMGARPAAWTTASTPIEMTGLEGIYDDGTLMATFQNITVSSNLKWSANILSDSDIDRELEIDLLLQGVDLARFQTGMRIDTIRMGLGQRRKYINLLMPEVRYQPQQLKGGYETLAFSAGDGRISIMVDPVQQPGKIYMEPNGIIEKYELTPLGWGDLDGTKPHRTAGYDEWDLYLRLYTNLGCQQRNCLVKITDLVEPNLFS